MDLGYTMKKRGKRMKQDNTMLRAAIVDDEKDLCFLLKAILKTECIEATSMYSLEDARNLLINIHPSMVFLDNHLPDGSGINFIKTIREELPLAKIIMMTAFNVAGEEKEALLKGADSFILKPLSQSAIKNTLSSLRPFLVNN